MAALKNTKQATRWIKKISSSLEYTSVLSIQGAKRNIFTVIEPHFITRAII